MRLTAFFFGSALLLQPAAALAQYTGTGLFAFADYSLSYGYFDGGQPNVDYRTDSLFGVAAFPALGPVSAGVSITNPTWIDGDTSLLTAVANASARPGILKAFAAVDSTPDDFTGAMGNANASASFFDSFTVAGNAPRVQFTLTSRLDGAITDAGNAGQGFTLQAPLAAGLQLLSYGVFGIGGSGWNQFTQCGPGGANNPGNTYCTLSADKAFYGNEAFSARQFYTFEVANGTPLLMSLGIGAGATSTTASSGDGEVDLTNTGVFEGFSGSGLTGVSSLQFGALRSVGGVFAYEEVHALNAAVPEPASWAMLIIGFGLTGAVMRRRTSRAVAA